MELVRTLSFSFFFCCTFVTYFFFSLLLSFSSFFFLSFFLFLSSGTDASIPTHIDNITKRNYVQLGSGRRLLPTRLGIVLVQGYLRIDPDLILPRIRANIETQCNLIASGGASKNDVVKH